MKTTLLVCGLAALLAGCSNPKDTIVPVTLDKMEAIKLSLEKLTQEERELFSKYAMRHTVGAAFGGLFGIKADPIPEGMTIGKAIEEQREFVSKEAAKEAQQKAQAEKLKAEQEVAMSAMRDAATVAILSKEVRTDRGYSGIVMDENLIVKFGYKNNTDREIAGIKGTVDVYDVFGDVLVGFALSNDASIKPGQTVIWEGSRSMRFGPNKEGDRKFSTLPEDKYKVVWKPKMVVFSGGKKMLVPE